MKSKDVETYRLSKGQHKFLSQLKDYMEENSMFKNKEEFDILSYEDVPFEGYLHSSKMGSRWTLNTETFLNHLTTILKTRIYNEHDKQALKIIRETCIRQDYPFQEFTYNPKKET